MSLIEVRNVTKIFHYARFDIAVLLNRFGVLTVPTTIVLAPTGEVRAVNHGFAPLPKLRAQVALSTTNHPPPTTP
ncbi:MAG TPA: hypothetical protein PLG99_10580, partial [Kaistiaceae bacterium]|nr:hypothetical protein [Kaistiaceae bacterium]